VNVKIYRNSIKNAKKDFLAIQTSISMLLFTPLRGGAGGGLIPSPPVLFSLLQQFKPSGTSVAHSGGECAISRD